MDFIRRKHGKMLEKLSLVVFDEELPMALKEQLKADLRIAFGKYLEETEDHPLKNIFYEYLLQVFKVILAAKLINIA